MRNILRQARIDAGQLQRQTAEAVGISERYYRSLEAGSREGKCTVWDKLEELFKIPQKELRKDDEADC